MKTKKALLIASLAVNLLLIGAAGIIVNKQGGMGFIEEQYQAMESKEEFPEYYRQKKDIFEALEGDSADKIFLGDSITDLGFMNLCHFWSTPVNSQLAKCLDGVLHV